METHNYNVELVWNEGRKGHVSSPELLRTIEVATPPEFDKGVPNVWSPEHLFTAAVNSCFMTTFLAIADYSKFEFQDLKVSSVGVLEKVEGKYLMTKVILKPILMVENEDQIEKGLRLMQKAEGACLISNSIKSEVVLEAEVVLANEVEE
jgi:peroxiredoxin-like protein